MTIGARMSEHEHAARASRRSRMKCADVALLAEPRRRDFQQKPVGRAVWIMTIAAVLQDRRMGPQKRPALLRMTGVTDLVNRRLHQLILIRAAMRVVAVGADHQSFAQRHVRRHVHLILFVEVTPETDLGLGPSIDERVGAELGGELEVGGLVHDLVAVDAFDAAESVGTGLPERLVTSLMTVETRGILALGRF